MNSLSLEGMSEEDIVDTYLYLIDKLKRSVEVEKSNLLTARSQKEKEKINEKIQRKNTRIFMYRVDLKQHTEMMINKGTSINQFSRNVASTFPAVDILESLHSRISALESRQP